MRIHSADMENETYKNLLEKFLRGEATPKEIELLDERMNDHPDGDFDSISRSIWGDGTIMSHNLPDEGQKEKMKNNLLNRINAEEDFMRSVRVNRKREFLHAFSLAASILVVAMSVVFLILGDRQIHEYEVVAERGQKSSVTLPDGSHVWLNSASRITYTSDFNKKNRNITLEGEAYFDVAKNKKIPFVVNASEMSITAVGTEFNVRNYSDEDEVCTTLVEGKVIASTLGCDISLTYGQEAVLNRNSGEMSFAVVSDLNHMVPWRSNEMLVDGESLDNLSRILSRMYNVDVYFENDSIKTYTYTGLIRNNSLQNVLELVSNTSPVAYGIYDDKIVFTTK